MTLPKDIYQNDDRNRAYGLRIGDLVSPQWQGMESSIGKCTVIAIGVGGDNNRVKLENEDGESHKWVAEHCEIITKVEDMEENNLPVEKRITQINYYRDLVSQFTQIALYIEQGHNYSHKLPNLKNTFRNLCVTYGFRFDKQLSYETTLLKNEIFIIIYNLTLLQCEGYNRKAHQKAILNEIYFKIQSL